MALYLEHLYRKASAGRIPLDGCFELSPLCNFSCRMCYVRQTKTYMEEKGRSLIPPEAWLDMARQGKELGLLHILLTGGEPFLYPGFRDLYEALHDMGFLLSINTNGSLIDEKAIAWLKKRAPYRVNLTLYGACAESYEKVCGNGGGYEKALRAAGSLKEAGIPLVINASMIPENAGDLKGIIETGKALNVNTRVATYMCPPARRQAEESDSRFSPETAADMFFLKEKYLLGEEAWSREKENLLRDTESETGDVKGWGTDSSRMQCRAGRCSFWISWEGAMTACGLFPYPVKTWPFQTSLKECWIKINEAVLASRVLKGCQNCSRQKICHPCAAAIYNETGGVDQKAPYLCEMTEAVCRRLLQEREHQEESI